MSARRPSGELRVGGILVLAALAALCGCSKRAAPTAPGAQLPPVVVAVSPPARAVRVTEAAPIWAQFDRALDPAKEDTRHVFLKIDTRRLPVTLRYESSTRRILIDPGGPLRLRTTYTVQFAPGLRTADGDSLGSAYFWQFTTIGVRLPGAPMPLDGATGESPLSELLWSGTDPAAGATAYDIYTGGDSAAIASRAVPPFTRRPDPFFVPDLRWPEGVPFYWSVRATNLETGESIDGPVWRFEVLPASTPVDSVIVRPRSMGGGWLFQSDPYFYFQQCTFGELAASPDRDNYVHWNLAALGPGIRVAGAYAVFTPTTAYRDGFPHGTLLDAVANYGTICIGAASPYTRPKAGLFLAPGHTTPDTRLRFDGDRIAAFAEAAARHNADDGTMIATNTEMHVLSQFGVPPGSPNGPMLVLYVYRPPPAPARPIR